MRWKQLRGVLLIFVWAVMLAACASASAQRQKYVAAHPELPIDAQNAIINGEIITGMGPGEVRASLGEPASIVKQPATAGSTVERWIYFKKLGIFRSVYEVRFVDGTAREIKSDGYMTSHMSGIYSGAQIP